MPSTSAGVSPSGEPSALTPLHAASQSPSAIQKKRRPRPNGRESPLSSRASAAGSSPQSAAKGETLERNNHAEAGAPASPLALQNNHSSAPATLYPLSPLACLPPAQPVASSAFSRSLSGRTLNSPYSASRPPIPGDKPPGPVDVVLEQPCIYKQQDFSVPLHAVSPRGPQRGSASSTASTQNGASGRSGAFFAGWSESEEDVCVEKSSGGHGDDDGPPFGLLLSMSSSVMEWKSRFAFVLATIGAAVGIGCVWRFPTYCYKFGGGAFLVPYVLMLVLLGMPLLTLEMALGQVFRGGHMKLFNLISPRLRGLAAATILQAFFICAYYSVFLSWGLHYFLSCWQAPLPWVVSPQQVDLCAQFHGDQSACENAVRPATLDVPASPQWAEGTQRLHGGVSETGPNVCAWIPAQLTAPGGGVGEGRCSADIRAKAQDFLFTEVLGLSAKHPGSLTFTVLLGLAFVWVQVFFSLFKGLQSLTAVIYAAVLLPIFAILLVMISALTLDGADLGLSYLFSFNWRTLVDQPEIWGEAASQVFFSLGVFQGVMTAYASHKKVTQNTIVDATAVAGSNTVLSFVSGVATFAIAGHVAKRVGAIDRVTGAADLSAMNIAGSQLVFVLYPISLATLPAPQLFCALFFLAFFLLGITSAISFVQPVIDLLKASRLLKRTKRWKLTLAACVVGFLLGLPFCLRSGIYLIESADYHWSVIGLTFLGCCESLAFGWVYGLGRQVQAVGLLPVAIHAVSYLGGATLAAVILFVVSPPNRFVLASAVCLPLMLVGSAVALYLSPQLPAQQAPGLHPTPLQSLARKPSLASLSEASGKDPVRESPAPGQRGGDAGARGECGSHGAFPTLPGNCGEEARGEAAMDTGDSPRSGVALTPSPSSLRPSRGACSSLTAPATLSIRDRMYCLYFGNVEHLRLNLNAITASNARVVCLWPAWSVVIKYVCPPILLFLLFNELGKGAFLSFGGLPLPYHAAALAVLGFIAFLVFLGVFLPQFWGGFVPEKNPRRKAVGKQGKGDWATDAASGVTAGAPLSAVFAARGAGKTALRSN
ncbi:putative sodium-dependent transporter [Neospora caninum Liverpool]|uniref:Putative sodium-dependent transporter n=1 Tax=Neospora caninum (strain Liverpool) TaxID=572307 RepID=F0VBH4_NEOCL|nr:putative sodium-dependent transporter [Neospora caninum Liverpool]CBZ50958.1 putative sodium-dependent transporter [Neospora caninum Liverpool]CEL68259.1 TPA: sodium-dependent transporter, putative [Neospora caninum Liverpool]|eukprot:XP_003880991.1 putative sodium-dependent transporter [Neospora caninum Liverpool]